MINNSHPSSSTRRSIKNFSGANNSTRMYYCETCRIACGGHSTYQAHLNGSKHKKKELVAQINPININSKTNLNIFRCELCDITCTSSDAYKAHLDGSKHEKAMKLHRKLGKTIPSIDPQILNNTITSSSQSNSISINDDQQISSSHLFENSIQPIGEEYIETTYDNTNKPILHHCKLCECKFNDIKGKEMHLKGKRHRLSYKVNRKKTNN
jgi:zinc finger RNA-binding protein